MAEDTLTVRLNDDVSGPARVAASGVQALLSALKDLESTEVSNNAAAALDELSAAAKRGGSGAREALQDLKVAATNAANAALGAQRAWTQSGGAASGVDRVVQKLKEAHAAAKRLEQAELDVARAAAKMADKEDEAYKAAVKAGSRVPTELQAASGREKGGFEKILGLVNKVFGPEAAGGLARGATTLAGAADKLGPAGPALMQGGKLLAMGAAAIVVAGIALATVLAVGAYKLLEAGLKLAVAQTSIRESFESSISKMVGGAKEAKDIFNTAIKIAVDLGIDKDEVLRKAKELVGVGFRGAEIDLILRVRADIAAGGSEEKANAFQKALEKLKSGKQFGQETLNGLAEAGINADAVLQKLSTQLGITVDKVKEKLKAGQIDVKTGMAAIIAAAQGQYGGAGSGAANTIPAKLQGLKTLFEDMFSHADLSGIKGALDAVKKLFEGPEGEKFKAAVNTLFGKISDIFGKAFTGKEGEARLTRFITGITKVMEGAAVIVEAAGPSIISILDGLSKIVDRNGSTTGGSWLQSLALGIAAVAGALVGQDFVSPLQGLFGIIDQIAGFATRVQAEATSIGGGIIQGLIDGIMNMGPNVISALGGVVQSAINAARAKLDSHSPSRVFTDIGEDTGMGYVIGVHRTAGLVAHAGQSLAAAAIGGASNDNAVPAGAGIGSAAGGGATTIIVQVQSAPGQTREHAQAQGDAAGEAAHRAWVRSHSRWVREQGRAA